jgi:hypothetical protein
MTNNSKKLFDLLKYSNELKNNGKTLRQENPKNYSELLDFLVIIEKNLHLKQKDVYIQLIQMFLSKKTNAEDFSFHFIAAHDNVNETLREMEQDFEKRCDELSNLSIENKKYQIGNSFMFMYDYCDDFGFNSDSLITDEVNLRNTAKMLLSKLKEV